jgi:hypothetical protein
LEDSDHKRIADAKQAERETATDELEKWKAHQAQMAIEVSKKLNLDLNYIECCFQMKAKDEQLKADQELNELICKKKSKRLNLHKKCIL